MSLSHHLGRSYGRRGIILRVDEECGDLYISREDGAIAPRAGYDPEQVVMTILIRGDGLHRWDDDLRAAITGALAIVADEVRTPVTAAWDA